MPEKFASRAIFATKANLFMTSKISSSVIAFGVPKFLPGIFKAVEDGAKGSLFNSPGVCLPA